MVQCVDPGRLSRFLERVHVDVGVLVFHGREARKAQVWQILAVLAFFRGRHLGCGRFGGPIKQILGGRFGCCRPRLLSLSMSRTCSVTPWLYGNVSPAGVGVSSWTNARPFFLAWGSDAHAVRSTRGRQISLPTDEFVRDREKELYVFSTDRSLSLKPFLCRDGLTSPRTRWWGRGRHEWILSFGN